MALQELTTYCDQTNLESLLSRLGVKFGLDNNNDGLIDADEQRWLTDACIHASEDINLYLWHGYTHAHLATSNLVNRWATVIAATHFCRHKGNPVPESLQEWYEEVMEKLEKQPVLPGVPRRRTGSPGWSNTSIDLRFTWKVIRKLRQTSSRERTQLQEHLDYREIWSYEI